MHVMYTLDGLPVDCWRMYAKDFFLTMPDVGLHNKPRFFKHRFNTKAHPESGRACTPLTDRLGLDVVVSCSVGSVGPVSTSQPSKVSLAPWPSTLFPSTFFRLFYFHPGFPVSSNRNENLFMWCIFKNQTCQWMKYNGSGSKQWDFKRRPWSAYFSH